MHVFLGQNKKNDVIKTIKMITESVTFEKLSLKNLYYYMYATKRTCSREGHHRPMAREDSGKPLLPNKSYYYAMKTIVFFYI
jgi:hypothetical protein